MILWVNFAWFARLVIMDQVYLSAIFLKIAWFVTPMLFMFLYFLIIYLLKEENKYKILNKLIILLSVIASFLAGFSSWIISGVKYVNNSLTIIYGDAMLPFLAIVFFVICATLFQLFRGYFISNKEKRGKIQYFLIGVFLFFIINGIFNIFLPIVFEITHLYWIGDYSTIILLFFTAYSITKRRLFGVRVALTQLLIGVIAVLLLINFGSAETYFDFIFRGVLFIGFVVAGYLLISSTSRELKVREELERANKKLEIANKKLEKLDKAKSEFLDITSHQLRTPLTAVKGYISMILEGDFGRVPIKIKSKLENVFESNERLINLVNNLLNVSRIEAGRIDLKSEKLDLLDLISSIREELLVRANEKKQKVKINSSDTLPLIDLDRSKIRQVFINLIDNAIKYTPDGGEIDIILEKTNSCIRVSVKDSGVGISKEEIFDLFKVFSRGKNSSRLNTGGVGIGLYIAKKFVELHNGKIWVESRGEGKGSTFIVELPTK